MKRTHSPFDPVSFVQRHGIVLEAAKGPIPNLAQEVAGEPIAAGWWSHRKGREIFRATRMVRDSPDILVCRLVGNHITYIHRELWPPLVRLSGEIGPNRLACVVEEHTVGGAHKVRTIPLRTFIPEDVRRRSQTLTREEALALIGARRMRAIFGNAVSCK